MSSKKLIIIIVASTFVLFIGAFLVYKAAIIKTANEIMFEDENAINSAIALMHNAKTLQVDNKADNLSINHETINYKNLYALNIYDDFSVTEDSMYTRYYKDDDKYITLTQFDNVNFDNIVELYEPIVNESISKFLATNKLNSSEEIIEYLYNHKIEKNNLFTSFKKIGDNNILYSLYSYYVINHSLVREYYKLDGNVKGYLSIFNDGVINASISDGYIVNYKNFTLDEALDFLGYVHINQDEVVSNEREGMYFLLEYNGRRIYSDEENPLFFNTYKNDSIKEFLPQSNCTLDCIHNYSQPVATYKDGGSQLYKYSVDNETYYMIKCNKLGSTYNDGTDVIISKNGNNLANKC